ncbi:glycosyltransferase family 2 protein [Flavobacterium sp.]|uniref:glycosyltransferase family 2 protein n=1 Tax=Flavobacterium sp. TaxID=239 RepID=UPI002FDE272A
MNTIAVILINYNSAKYTIDCIKSIWDKTSSDLDYEIIVVDNKSEMDDLKLIDSFINEEKKSNLKLIKSQINTGFGGGNMIGAQVANAKYLAFINNDSIFINDCLSLLYNAMEANENYGVCGPKAYKEDGSILPTLDHYASLSKEFLGRSLLEKINPEKYPNRKKNYINHQKGQFVSGSFMMLRAIDFWNVGGFDTNIFLYHEETDLCKRINSLNKYSYLIPEAEFIHYHGASTPKSIAIKTELKLSQLYVIRKHYGYFKFKFLLTFFQLKYFFSSIFKPKYWSLFFVLIKGAHLSDSLKQKQTTK